QIEAALSHVQPQHVLAGRELYIAQPLGTPRLPSARAARRNGSEEAAVECHREHAAASRARHPKLDIVEAGLLDVYRVLEPLEGLDPADIVAEAQRIR